MAKKVNFKHVISGTFLIAGTMIGAGMLGLPLVTAHAGFWPGMLITIIVWFFMYSTGLLFLEVTLWMPDGSNVLSITEHFFGRVGRLISGGMFIFLYYCLMIAYFAAGAPLLANAFSNIGFNLLGWEMFAFFGLVFAVIVGIGPKSIDRINIIMSIAMLSAWLMLIGSGVDWVDPIRFEFAKWSPMITAMPILFSAFGFHNVIPSLCSYLKRDKKSLRFAIFWGSFLPLVIYVVWQWLVIGVIPQEILVKTFKEKTLITTSFAAIGEKPFFTMIARFFAFFAIVTSTLGVAFSMVDFLGDGFKVKERKGVNRVALTLLTFIPPFVFSALNPGIFTVALGFAGGFGEAFLNGLLPIGLFWAGKYSSNLTVDLQWLENRGILLFLMSYALFVIVLEMIYLID